MERWFINKFSQLPSQLIGLTSDVFLAISGFILIYTGAIHLSNSYFFLSSLLNYKLTGVELSKLFAIVLPAFHIATGLLILSRTWTLTTLPLVATLFSVYALVQVSVLMRGLEIDCGCFGSGSEIIDGWSVMRVGVLALFAWAVTFVGWVNRGIPSFILSHGS